MGQDFSTQTNEPTCHLPSSLIEASKLVCGLAARIRHIDTLRRPQHQITTNIFEPCVWPGTRLRRRTRTPRSGRQALSPARNSARSRAHRLWTRLHQLGHTFVGIGRQRQDAQHGTARHSMPSGLRASQGHHRPSQVRGHALTTAQGRHAEWRTHGLPGGVPVSIPVTQGSIGSSASVSLPMGMADAYAAVFVTNTEKLAPSTEPQIVPR